MRSSSDWEKTPEGWQRINKPRTRGLNRNFNHPMKDVFKGAASGVIMHHQEPLYSDYLKMLEQGVKPPLAKLTLASTLAIFRLKRLPGILGHLRSLTSFEMTIRRPHTLSFRPQGEISFKRNVLR
jgi:hypothetical protein